MPLFEDPHGMERHQSSCVTCNDDMMLDMIVLKGALPEKHKTLKAELQNQHNLGINLRPNYLNQVMKALQNYVGAKEVPLSRREGGE